MEIFSAGGLFLIPAPEITRLKASVDLAALVRASGVSLKPVGKNLVGLCPFHSEKSPSFTVTPATNLWHCFGCGKAGNGIQFLMELEGIDFPEAVRRLSHANGTPHNGSASPTVSTGIIQKGAAMKQKPPIDLMVPEIQKTVKLAMNTYEKSLKNSPQAQEYLLSRGLGGPDITENFRVGYADGSLPGLLPAQEMPDFTRAGILMENGQEFFGGYIVIAVTDENGIIRQLYGRNIANDSKRPDHLYLVPHTAVMNPAALVSDTIVLCESPLDLLSFYVSGIRNVTCSYGTDGFSGRLVPLFAEHGVRRVLIAFDGDAAGDRAAEKIAEKFTEAGIESARVAFEAGMDPNSVLVKYGREALRGMVLESSPEIPSDVPDASAAQVSKDRISFRFADRAYRIDGFSKNRSAGSLSVTIHAQRGDLLFPEKVELYLAKDRERFVRLCARELGLEEEIIKSDLSRMLPELREMQDRMIAELLKPKTERTEYRMSAAEREEAMEVLLAEDPLSVVCDMIESTGVIGERLNIKAAFLASITRNLAEPLHVIFQSPSSAGKSTLMKAILATIPEESKHVFTEISPNALFYFPEDYLRHKTIGIMEDFGIGQAGYSLKTLLSDGYLKKASAMRDPETGLNTTREYVMRGPVQAFTSSNNAWIVEDLQNRTVVLVLNPTAEQTRAIHAWQRRARSREGIAFSKRSARVFRILANVQRLIRPLRVINDYVEHLTFPSESHRTRRDFDKYLTLLDAQALLCQFRRGTQTIEEDGELIECARLTKSDIGTVNPIAEAIFTSSLDDLGPITRRFLSLLRQMVEERRGKEDLKEDAVLFTRRQAREYTKWSEDQVQRHMDRLLRFELVSAVRGRQGQTFLYSLEAGAVVEPIRLMNPDLLPEISKWE